MNRASFLFRLILLGMLLSALASGAAYARPADDGSAPDAPKPGVLSPAPPLGAPGTVFRYDATFGELGVPYLVDNEHLYFPIGLGMDASGNPWVAEAYGARAMKFSNAGAFLMSVGEPGRSDLADETHFGEAEDVGVDGSGNFWVVDGTACRVVKYDAAGNFLMQLGTTWECGNDNSRFASPLGVAFDSAGNIYVSDGDNHRIQIFDSSGAYLATIGGTYGDGDYQFKTPVRIAIGADDYLYVADRDNHRVQIFDETHTYVATLGQTGTPGGGADHFAYPRGVAVDASYIYVADTDNHRVQIFDITTRLLDDTLGSYGDGNYGFDSPRDVAVDVAGNIYVADSYNHRVQKFNSSLLYQLTIGVTGVPYLTDGSHLNFPSKVAVNADGDIAVIEDEGRGHRLVVLDASGAPKFTIGEAGVGGSDNEHFSDARGVAFDPQGNIFVGDCANHRVQVFHSSGVYSATLGSFGQGDDQFSCPKGVAFDSQGNLYVADAGNARVQIFNNTLTYSATLGVTGVSGDDNAHFNNPSDVAVDAAGNIYVADAYNERVQKFNSSLAWQATLGVTGECGYDFAHLCVPFGVAVDGNGNLYVVEYWNPRVQVFDPAGAYLTTIGGDWGTLPTQFNHLFGVAVDSAGNVYVPDTVHQRLQKFAPGVPNWGQANINGFGERFTTGVTTLQEFNGALYAGSFNTWDLGKGAQVYRSNDGTDWSAASEPGFGVYTTTQSAILDLEIFGGQLYAAAGWGGIQAQLWRSPDGTTWEPVTTDGFGDGGNTAITTMAVYNGALYAGATNASGAQIWRSSSGDSDDWAKVAPDDDGAVVTRAVTGLAAYKGYLYAAVESTLWGTDPAQVWRSANGSAWETVINDGFGDANNFSVGGMAVFNGYLYLGTWNEISGAQLWRTLDGVAWEQVIDDGFGDPNTFKIESLFVFASHLYAMADNATSGLEVWKLEGSAWEQVNLGGFGDENNQSTLIGNATTKFKSQLYLGTWNVANGGELWRYDPLERTIFLPIIQRE